MYRTLWHQALSGRLELLLLTLNCAFLRPSSLDDRLHSDPAPPKPGLGTLEAVI